MGFTLHSPILHHVARFTQPLSGATHAHKMIRVAANGTAPSRDGAAAPPRRRWTPEEALSLAESYPAGEAVSAISQRLARSTTAIYGKARRLKLSRPQRGRTAQVLDLVAPTPDNPPFMSPASHAEAPAPVPKAAKAFQLTPLGGRQTVWSPDLVRRLVLLWVAGFHHTTIAAALGLTPCGVSSKAVRVSLPYRGTAKLSKDVEAARRVDAAGGAVPPVITDTAGRRFIGKSCNMNGNLFYGERGIRTSVEAKLTLHYDRMSQAAF